jgi:Zn-dependent peptidase ImmA (M78 family)
MRWVSDPTGRFPERPYYEREEFDRECEGIVAAFLRKERGAVAYPITTNELTILIEREAASLDLYADLSAEGEAVEGMTKFYRRGKPAVHIAAELSEPGREHRLRTTLTHELGHVRFHTFLWTFEAAAPSPRDAPATSPRCHRETVIGASRVDWLEWQAGYASGAFLMPLSALRRTVRQAWNGADVLGNLAVASDGGREVIRRVQSSYLVSEDAARVRLLQLGILTE